MKKALAGLLALVAVVLLALPPLFGRLAENAFMAQSEETPFADYLEVEVVDFERGLYGSTATIRFGLDSSYVELLRAAAEADSSGAGDATLEELEALRGDATFSVVADYAHGPVGFKRTPFIGLAQGVMHPEIEAGGVGERWRQRLDVPYLMELRHRLGFGGASRFDVVLPEIDYRGDEMRVTMEGWDVWAEYDPGSQEISGKAGIELLEVSDDETNLRIETMRAEADGTILGPRLLLGEGGFQVDRLSLLQPLAAIQQTDMVGLRATGGTELSDDGSAFNSSFTYAVDSLLLGERALREAELTMAALNIDRDAAERWAVFTEEAALADRATIEAEAMSQELVGLIYDFLVAGPALEVDPARFTYNGDPFRARIRVETDASTLPEREAFEGVALQSLGFWTRLFTAEAELEASRGLARALVAESQETTIRSQMESTGRSLSDQQIEEMAGQQADLLLQMMVGSGFVEEEEGRYVSRIRYQDGQLTANGQALALPGGMPGA